MKITHMGITTILLLIASVSLTSSHAWAQGQLIDWSLASPGISNDGIYTGTVGSVGWTLDILGANAASVAPGDGELLRGIIGSLNTATYQLSFTQPVLVTWSNDFLEPGLGGLANTEFVEISGGVGSFDLTDNSANVAGLAGAGSFSPVLSVVGGTDLRASFNVAGEHAYYRASSVGLQQGLTWTHTSTQTKIEGWRVNVTQCDLVDWSAVAGNGAYTGSVGGVGWDLTVFNADTAMPDPGDSTLLRATIGGASNSATYTLEFDEAVHIAWWNDTAPVVGGLAGLDAASNEYVDLIGAATSGTFNFFDNSANIPHSPGAFSVSPVFTVQGADLRAESSPGIDHAYYRAQTSSPATLLSWTHNNAVTKAEVWRVCVAPVTPTTTPVPALGIGATIALLCMLLLSGIAAAVRLTGGARENTLH